MSDRRHKPTGEAFAKKGSFHGLAASCANCGVANVFAAMGAVSVPEWFEPENPIVPNVHEKPISAVVVGMCSNCGTLAIGCILSDSAESPFLVFPLDAPPDRAPPGLDPEISKDYHEARLVLALSANASAVLTRRALQHVLRRKLGVHDDTVGKEIEAARKDKENDLSGPTRRVLHQIRKISAFAAHPPKRIDDLDFDVTPEEARYILEALELCFDDLYSRPARVAAMEATIASKGTRPADQDKNDA